MLLSFIYDVKTCLGLCRRHACALIVTIVATLVMILMASNNLRYSFGSGTFAPYHIDALIYYGLIPLGILIILKRKNPFQLGLGWGDVKFWVPASLLYLVIALPITLYGTSTSNIAQFYQSQNFDWFEYVLKISIYMLGWEYLFRGFMIEGLRNSLKEGAILIQMIPFTLLHLGKPDAETITCIFSGLAWGYICYRARSFWPAFFMHMIINLTVKAQTNGLLF